MSEITAAEVKRLRDVTGAGMMDCKKALTEAKGDFDEAVDTLRKWGLAGARSRAGRVATEGLVEAYLHQTNPDLPPKVGVLLELDCETDFVAKSPEFRGLAKDIAVHIAWAAPRWISREDVDEETLERERKVLRESDLVKGKSPDVVEKIIEGKIQSIFSEPGGALLEQLYWRDDEGKRTVGELIAELAAKVKENVVVSRFARFKVGEG